MLHEINARRRIAVAVIAALAVCVAMLAAVPARRAALTLPPGFQQSTAITG